MINPCPLGEGVDTQPEVGIHTQPAAVEQHVDPVAPSSRTLPVEMMKAYKVSPFSGMGGESFLNWYPRFKMYLDGYDLDEDQKMQALKLALSDAAFDWAFHREEESYDELVAALTRTFGGGTVMNKAMGFHKLSQAAEESINDFGLRLERAARRAYPDVGKVAQDRMVISQIMNGCLPRYQVAYNQVANETDLAKVREILETCEKSVEYIGIKAAHTTVSSGYGDPAPELERDRHGKNTSINQYRARFDRYRAPDQPAGPDPRDHWTQGYPNARSGPAVNANFDNRQGAPRGGGAMGGPCTYCGRPGHTKAFCRVFTRRYEQPRAPPQPRRGQNYQPNNIVQQQNPSPPQPQQNVVTMDQLRSVLAQVRPAPVPAAPAVRDPANFDFSYKNDGYQQVCMNPGVRVITMAPPAPPSPTRTDTTASARIAAE